MKHKMKHTFEAGDKVYCPPIDTDIYTLENGDSDSYAVKIPHEESFTLEGKLMYAHKLPSLFPVTEENRQLLSKLYGVEFKKPSLCGSELTKKLLENGWDCVPCWGSDYSDENARQHKRKDIANSLKSGSFCFENSTSYNFAVPFDPKTGKELSEEVLDESHWISVNERLPTKDGEYLVFMDDGNRKSVRINFFRLGVNEFVYFHEGVTHWQLPAPPKGGDNETI